MVEHGLDCVVVVIQYDTVIANVTKPASLGPASLLGNVIVCLASRDGCIEHHAAPSAESDFRVRDPRHASGSNRRLWCNGLAMLRSEGAENAVHRGGVAQEEAGDEPEDRVVDFAVLRDR